VRGHDMVGKAQTGTGKTAAFLVSTISDLLKHPIEDERYMGEARALILAPTRELAIQIGEDAEQLVKHTDLKVHTLVGGMDYAKQLQKVQKNHCDILVGTPGRLLDFANNRDIHLDQVEVLVIDEADRMLDMGFIHDIKRIMKLLPSKRQNLLFSATFSDDIRALAKQFIHNPIEVSVTPKNTTAPLVEQSIVYVDKGNKSRLLAKLIDEENWQQVLVFSRTKHGANRIAKQLSAKGITSLAIHGNKSQGARTKALAEFKNNQLRVLVATDIAARGIDIDLLPNVINYDLPHVPEDYVHRIGRTGRAGASGHAVSFVTNEDGKQLKAIQSLIGKHIDVMDVPGISIAPMFTSVAKPAPPKPKRPKKRRPAANRPRANTNRE